MTTITAHLNQHKALYVSLFILTLAHLTYTEYSIGRDQGVWTTLGLAIHNGRHYLGDFVHFHMPGLGWSFAWLFNFTDKPSVAVAMLNWFSASLSIVSCYFVLRKEINPHFANILAIGFAVLCSVNQNYWNISQKDNVAMAFVFLSTWIVIYDYRSQWLQFLMYTLAGFSIGIACLYKPVFGIAGIYLAIAVFIQYYCSQGQISFNTVFMRLLALLVGFCLFAGAFMLYLYRIDALDDAWFSLIELALWYSGNGAGFAKVLFILFLLSGLPDIHFLVVSLLQIGFWVPLIACGIVIYSRKQLNHSCWMLFPLLTGLSTYLVQQKAFLYQTLPWVYTSSMFALIAVYAIVTSTQKPWLKQGLTALTLVFFVSNIATSRDILKTLPAYLGMIERTSYLSGYKMAPGPTPLEVEQLSDWVAQNSSSDESIQVWGMETQIYSLSGRTFATRHHSQYMLESNIDKASLAQWQAQERKWFVRDLAKNKPKFFIINYRGVPIKSRSLEKATTARVPGLNRLLEQKYEKVKSVEMADVYQLREEA